MVFALGLNKTFGFSSSNVGFTVSTGIIFSIGIADSLGFESLEIVIAVLLREETNVDTLTFSAGGSAATGAAAGLAILTGVETTGVSGFSSETVYRC